MSSGRQKPERLWRTCLEMRNVSRDESKTNPIPEDSRAEDLHEASAVEDHEANEPDTAKQDDPEIDVESVANGLAADLDSLQTQLEEAQNRALRSSAELENFRRRANRQMDEERRYANLDLFRELLPIWDNMGRAVDAAAKAGEADALLEGFKMVCTQLEGVFERFHCMKIEAEGQPFDPHLHEAISQMPSPDHPGGTVLHVTQVGFLLHDRVVRPCQVVVSVAPPEPKTEEDAEPLASDEPGVEES